jgi:hypothetical protein
MSRSLDSLVMTKHLACFIAAMFVAVSPLTVLAEEGMGALRSSTSPSVAYGAQSRGLGVVDSSSSQIGRDGADELPGAITVTKTNMDQRHATNLTSALRVVPGVLAIGR